MTDPAIDREVIRELLELTGEDWARAQEIQDPEVLADLVLGARALGEPIDRTTIGAIEEYLSTISGDDWLSVVKLALPFLVNAL